MVLLPVEIPDADRDDLHVIATGVHEAKVLAKDLAVLEQDLWSGTYEDIARQVPGEVAQYARPAGERDAFHIPLARRLEHVVRAHVAILADLLPGTITRIAAQMDDGLHVGDG